MGPRFIAVAAGFVLALLVASGAFYWRQAAAPDRASPEAALRPDMAPAGMAAAPQLVPTPAVGSPSPAVQRAAAPPQATFDVVRVEPTGETLVAGRAAPAAAVTLLADGQVVAEATADDSGAFVLLPSRLTPGAHALALQSNAADGGRIASMQEVAVSVPKAGGGQVAVALQEANKPTLMLTDPTVAAEPQVSRAPGLSFKTAEVQEGQGFFATGSATPNARLRLYLNGSALKELTAGADGHWSIAIGRGLTPGRYTLRGDALDAAGKVVARAEVPFVAPDVPASAVAIAPRPAAGAAVAAVQTAKVTRGDNLWEISRKILGEGHRFTRIYAANSSQIRDPSLIYPGQVFVLPSRDE